MAFLSPGVYITERDESTIVPTVSNNVAFFAADFDKGPVDQPYVITTRKELIDHFGRPTNDNYNEWFQASKYLDYANQLIITRGFEAKPKVDVKAPRGDYRYTKISPVTYITPAGGNTTPTNSFMVTVTSSKFDKTIIPKVELGDIVTFTKPGKTPKDGLLCEITSMEVNTQLANEESTSVDIHFHVPKKTDPSFFNGITDMFSVTASHKNGKTFALSRATMTEVTSDIPTGAPADTPIYKQTIPSLANALSPLNMDIPTKVTGSNLIIPLSSNRLSATYPLIKNQEEWDFLNTKEYGDNTVNPLRQWISATAGDSAAPSVEDQSGKLLFFSRTPTSESIEVAIANAEDFETLYKPNSNTSYNHAIAFMKTNGTLSEGMYIQDIFQYAPSKDEVGIAFKQGNTVETFVVSFDPLGTDGNGKSNYIETVINEQSKLLYVLANKNNNEMPATYLYQDKYGKEIDTDPNSPTVGEMVVRGGSQFFYRQDAFGLPTMTLTVQGGTTPKISKGSLRDAYFTCEDKEKYEIDVVIGNERNPAAAQDLAESRKDCIAFIGARYEDTVGKKAIDATNAIVRYITEENTNKRVSGGMGEKLQRTMFSAFFGNYFKIYDTYNKTHRWINVAGDMAGVRCSVTTNNASWWVSAGMRRGIINGIERMAFTPSLPMRDQLYKNSINPLVTFPGTGNLVWGNKTMQAYASAFDRINVRNMFSTIERAMSKAAKSQLFEFNDPYTRNAILSMFNPYLATIKAGRGLTDFLVICDESNNTSDVISRNELRVDIYVKPNYAAEFINLNFVNVGTRSFSEVIGA